MENPNYRRSSGGQASRAYESSSQYTGAHRPRHAAGSTQRASYPPRDKAASRSRSSAPAASARSTAVKRSSAQTAAPRHAPRPAQQRAAQPAPRRSAASPSRVSRSRRASRSFKHRLMAFIRNLRYDYPRAFPIAGAAIVLVVVLAITIPALSGPDRKQQAPQATAAPSAVPVTQAPATATPAPQPAATPTPLPLPTMVNSYTVRTDIPNTDKALGLPEGPRVDDSYFDNTVFVGDSVSLKLQYFVKSEREKVNTRLLGNAKFLTAASFSARNALKKVTSESLHPTFQGQKMTMEDAIAAMGVDKVYIMLGLNDVGISGVEDSVENMLILLRKIKEKSPNVQIFVQSATPRLSGNKPTTAQLFKYNMMMYENILAMADQDIYYVDVAFIMRDEEGKLIEEYCSDADSMALHFNNTACRKWVDYLYTHALTPAAQPAANPGIQAA